MQDNNILVISGPTGSGESTLTKSIVDQYEDFVRLVTATSRNPRPGEQHGVDYYFFSKEGFESEIEKGTIGEYTYIKNRQTYYGAYLPALQEKLEKGYTIIANVDHVGLAYYKKHYNVVSIFIDVESIDIIAKRLKSRNPDMSPAELENRLHNAQNEIDTEREFYDHVIVNKEGALKKSVDEISTILKKEGYVA